MAVTKIKSISNNPSLEGSASFLPDVVFSTAAGVSLKMHILLPWRSQDAATGKLPVRPLIIFLQGSGWTSPDINKQIPQLAEYAREGYVTASITHRSYKDGHLPPAFLEDAKTAVRFLRMKASEYGIDSGRICFWGTSSGGNTAMLVAMTGDDPRYKTAEYPEYSDAVSLAISCFGPTDLPELFADIVADPGKDETYRALAGKSLHNDRDMLKELSPYLIMRKWAAYPPMLLLQGDADKVVPYSQSWKMFRALSENGNVAEMIQVKKAGHENSFWSRRVHRHILDFINRNL